MPLHEINRIGGMLRVELLSDSSLKVRSLGRNFSRVVRNAANDLSTSGKSKFTESDPTMFQSSKGALSHSSFDEKQRRAATASFPDATTESPLTRPKPVQKVKRRRSRTEHTLGGATSKSFNVGTLKKKLSFVDKFSAPPSRSPSDENPSSHSHGLMDDDDDGLLEPLEARCEKCHQTVHPVDLLTYQHHTWHKKCKPCARCNTPIQHGSPMVLVEGTLFHSNCCPPALRPRK